MSARSLLRPLLPAIVVNLVLAVAAHFVLGSWFGWTGNREAFPGWIGNGLPFVQFMAVAYLTDRFFRIGALQVTANRRVPKLALQLVTLLIYFLFLGSSVGIVFHESISAVLAASGIVGLAVGFALRGLLADVFSGIALHLDASLRTGDWIDVIVRGKEFSGRLLDIHWRTVVLADRNQNHVLIPNSEFAIASVVNRSLPAAATEFAAPLALPSHYERARIFNILENALARCTEAGVVLAQPAPYVRLGDLDPATGTLSYRMTYSLDLSAIGPVKAKSIVLSHAVDFLKAANLRLYPVQQMEFSRTSVPGGDRFSETAARLSVIADVPLLSVLSQDELFQLASNSVVSLVSGGQHVMRAGDEGESMVVVLEGRLRIMVGDATVATLWPGECAGEMSLLTGSRRSADVLAEGAVVLLEIPKAALTPILQANPALVERIAVVVAKRQASNSTGTPSLTGPQAANHDANPLISKIRRFFRLGG
ncbi:MAG TPA: cyclic nucleotide-binding domain-containing protein [Magnetospirillum sp.]|nr:cyclic nucleotide-binding domain-containing protein [Magnetospirillum sp.]